MAARRVELKITIVTDDIRRSMDQTIRAHGLEWRYPQLLLSDEELEAMEMRAFGRTLAAIDDLPTPPRVYE